MIGNGRLSRLTASFADWILGDGERVIHFPYPLNVGDVGGGRGEETGLAKGSGKWMREGNKERRKEGTGGREGGEQTEGRKQATRLSPPPSLSTLPWPRQPHRGGERAPTNFPQKWFLGRCFNGKKTPS